MRPYNTTPASVMWGTAGRAVGLCRRASGLALTMFMSGPEAYARIEVVPASLQDRPHEWYHYLKQISKGTYD